MSVLTVDNLTYSVKPHFWSKTTQILKGVTFAVAEREIFGFLGPNGAGKTTTIKAILGLLQPDGGDIRLFGRPPTQASSRAKLGFLPERAYFSEHLSGREVVIAHGLLAGLSRHDAKTRAQKLLERVGLAAAADRRLKGYSKGMLQRVGIAQALVSEPALVVFDEPMSGLDPLGRADVRDIMLELRAKGTTVFFSTHILPDAEMICDRVAIVMNGRTTRVGKLAELVPVSGQGVQIVVAALPADQRSALSSIAARIEERPEAVVLHMRDLKSANNAVDTLRKAGIDIVEMHGQRSSLEDLFIADAKGAKAS
ncbi:MAG: ABC transporter ATP-binding protein [Myxococcota bacterium]